MENNNLPLIEFNVERVAKVLFACNNQDVTAIIVILEV